MKQKILDLDLDGKYTHWVLSKITAFKYVHPNYISIVGLLTDLVILYSLLNNLLMLTGAGLYIRYSCDCLDGAVARKYNKVSTLGGILDTVADNTLIFVLFVGLLKLLEVNYFYLYAGLLVCTNLIYLATNQALVHHYNIKKPGGWFHNLYRFGVNNNAIIYSGFFIIFLCLT